jgi:hypothetical protein
MEDQLDEMRGAGQQTDRLIILNTGQMTNAARTARAAQIQAEAAQAGVKAIQRQMRQEQRAWINLTVNLPQEFKENEGVTGSIHLINTGKTPAKNLVGQFVIEEVKNGESPIFIYSGIARTIMSAGSVFPNSTLDGTVPWSHKAQGTTNVGPTIVNTADIKNLTDGKVFFVIHGRIDYRDVFNAPHWVTVCGWTAAPARNYTAKKCSDYNNVDNN